MLQKRHKGYVIGKDSVSDGTVVWKVRIKKPGNELHKRKLIVASVRDDVELARGLNVNFIIGTTDNKSGEEVLRAVDVCLEAPEDIRSKEYEVKNEKEV